MQKHPRRENGITTRYLAQTLLNPFNDIGLVEFSRTIRKLNTNIQETIDNLHYYFFFHLEEYGAEIDLILWNNAVIIPVEIKVFTDANSPDVKREIIRNCLYIENIKKHENCFGFNESQTVFPLLVYCKPYQEWKHGKTFNYFNNKFLLTKGVNQSESLDNWNKGKYPIPAEYTKKKSFTDVLNDLNDKMMFMSWDDIYKILINVNSNNSLTAAIQEMHELKDSIQSKSSTNHIDLISQQI